MSVSYTHLDVYKRQILIREVPKEEAEALEAGAQAAIAARAADGGTL